MLKRGVCHLTLITLLAVGLQVVAAPVAVADCKIKVTIDPKTGAPAGRGVLQCPGQGGANRSGGSRGGKSRPPAKIPESHVPDSGCLTDVGASSALRCAVEDKPGVPGVERVFVPPSEAEVRVALRLPDPTPRFGPDPEVNEWKMLVVGYPVWLWTDAPTRLSATARHDGLAMTLRAQWTSTRFDMGDGHSRTCTATTVYPKRPDRYGMPSPTCGYTYQKRSKPGRDYTVTATTHWRVSWFTGGHSGTLMTSYAGQRSLPIGELQALIKA